MSSLKISIRGIHINCIIWGVENHYDQTIQPSLGIALPLSTNVFFGVRRKPCIYPQTVFLSDVHWEERPITSLASLLNLRIPIATCELALPAVLPLQCQRENQSR